MGIIAVPASFDAYYFNVKSELITLDTSYNGNLFGIREFIFGKTSLSGNFAGFSYLNEKTQFSQNEIPVYFWFSGDVNNNYAHRFRAGSFTKLSGAPLNSTSYDAYVPAGTQIVVYSKTEHTPSV